MSVHREDLHDQATVGSTKSPWFRVPENVAVKHFPFSGEVVEILSTDRIDHAFHKLVASNILSAPVFDEQAQKYLGFLDIGDLLSLTYGMRLMLSVIPESAEVQSFDEAESPRAAEGTVGSLFAGPEPAVEGHWEPVTEETPLIEVLKQLSGSARRVPVINKAGRVVKIISQSAVVQEVYSAVTKETHLPEEFTLTPRHTGIGIKDVIVVQDHVPAKTAFVTMMKEKVSAIGVVDAAGKLFSCVSTKDIRLLPSIDRAAIAGRALLNHSTREYISLARRASEVSGKAHAPVAVVGLDAPLLTVIGKLAATKMHRIFIVDEGNRAVGVISVSDVISLLMQQALAVAPKDAPAA